MVWNWEKYHFSNKIYDVCFFKNEMDDIQVEFYYGASRIEKYNPIFYDLEKAYLNERILKIAITLYT